MKKSINQWKKYILKSNHFSSKQERLKGMILSLMLLVSMLIMSIDVYGSLKSDFIPMVWFESLLIIVCVLLYLFFPIFVSLEKAIMLFVGLIIFFILLSLTLPGYNQEFVLFALAVIPASIFFLLGLELGKKWSIVIVLFVLLSTLNAYFEWIIPVFKADLLLQVSFAYIVLSIFYYLVEKERVSYEEELTKTIKEKNILLKEIHHRAKNNLQTIMGLLESQAMRTEHKICKKLLRSQRYRLQSMSLLHENLSHEANYEKVNMFEYLTQIILNLQKTTNHRLDMKLERFQMQMSEAVNMGLLLNELLSNAIKHAYPIDSIGNIEIKLVRIENDCILSVKDYGKGFNTCTPYNSLGLVLVDDLINFFPEGNLMFNFENGTEVIAQFNV